MDQFLYNEMLRGSDSDPDWRGRPNSEFNRDNRNAGRVDFSAGGIPVGAANVLSLKCFSAGFTNLWQAAWLVLRYRFSTFMLNSRASVHSRQRGTARWGPNRRVDVLYGWVFAERTIPDFQRLVGTTSLVSTCLSLYTCFSLYTGLLLHCNRNALFCVPQA